MGKVWAEILDRNLNPTDGPLLDVTGLDASDPLSRAGRFNLTVPLSERAKSVQALLTVLKVYVDEDVLGWYLIETVQHSQGSDGAISLRFRGRSLLAELGELSVGVLDTAVGGVPLTNTLQTILAPASSWSYDTAPDAPQVGYNTLVNLVYARFRYDSILAALVGVSKLSGENFIIGNGPRQVIWVRDQWVDAGLRALQGAPQMVRAEENDDICFIQSLRESEEGANVINRVYPFGSGTGETRLGIKGSSYTIAQFADYTINKAGGFIDYSPSGYAYPLRETGLQFREIAPLSNTDADVQAASDMLVDASMRWLAERCEPRKFYTLSVTKLRPGRIRPGMQIQVIYQDEQYELDTLLNVTEVTCRLIGDRLTWDLTVTDGTAAPQTDAHIVTGRLEQGRVLTALPQMGPSIDTIPYREPLDDDNSAQLRFWLGEEVAQVQQVLLRFRVDPLRSTVKTVGGDASGSGTATLPNHAHAVPDHQHGLVVAQGGAGDNVSITHSGSDGFLQHDGAAEDYTVLTTPDSGAVTTPSGGGGAVFNVNVDISGAVSADYGVHEESGANSYDEDDLTYQINGSAVSATRQDEGGGWFSYDLTAQVVNSDTLRPVQERNFIDISPTANNDKSCMINAQLQIRMVLQSVAYV